MKSHVEKRINLKTIFFTLLLVLSFVFSAGTYFMKMPGKRYIFRFESVDKGKSAIEYRILPNKAGDEKIRLYVDELLLGPKTERSRPLFSLGTRQTFCFLRSSTLYVNLTPDLLQKNGNAGDIMNGIELFKKNVLLTFPTIKDVELYIDGKNVL